MHNALVGTIGARTWRPPVVEGKGGSIERRPRVPNASDTAPPPLPRHELSPRHELAPRDMRDELVGTIGARTWRPPVEEEEEVSYKRSPPAPEASDTAGEEEGSCGGGGGGFIHPASDASNTAGDSDAHTGARGQILKSPIDSDVV